MKKNFSWLSYFTHIKFQFTINYVSMHKFYIGSLEIVELKERGVAYDLGN